MESCGREAPWEETLTHAQAHIHTVTDGNKKNQAALMHAYLKICQPAADHKLVYVLPQSLRI